MQQSSAPAAPAISRPRRSGRRALVLIAAIAVPAMAAPDDWSAFEIGNAGASTVVLEPMPFEQPGDSFPGSAFYYLAPDSEDVPLVAGVHSDAGTAAYPVIGPAARAIGPAGSFVDRARALQCMTQAIYYEAASEPDAGQRAVAQVVLNRVAHPAYPNTVCGVVFQGSERVTGCQFSFTCDGALARVPSRFFWERAQSVARAALTGYVERSVGLATHYHTIQVHPYWADSLSYLGTIGAHRFYRFGGKAGTPGAFRFAYLGGEPLPVPHPRSAAPAAPGDLLALDPVALQRAFAGPAAAVEAPGSTPVGSARPAPAAAAAPRYTPEQQARGGDARYGGSSLPAGDGIRPEYQNSGQWIAQPGS